ncbi:MAG: hypothetical protein ACI85I_000464 [Arenicella sp.]|jgi:hypothetical protein
MTNSKKEEVFIGALSVCVAALFKHSQNLSNDRFWIPLAILLAIGFLLYRSYNNQTSEVGMSEKPDFLAILSENQAIANYNHLISGIS